MTTPLASRAVVGLTIAAAAAFLAWRPAQAQEPSSGTITRIGDRIDGYPSFSASSEHFHVLDRGGRWPNTWSTSLNVTLFRAEEADRQLNPLMVAVSLPGRGEEARVDEDRYVVYLAMNALQSVRVDGVDLVFTGQRALAAAEAQAGSTVSAELRLRIKDDPRGGYIDPLRVEPADPGVTPTVIAACEALRQEHEQAMAASLDPHETSYLEVARTQFACVGRGATRWAQTLTALQPSTDPDQPQSLVAERRLYRVRETGSELLETTPIIASNLQNRPDWQLLAFDFNDDGSDELIEVSTDVYCAEPRVRILSWWANQFSSYDPVATLQAIGVSDVNGDGRPDLLLRNPFRAADISCGLHHSAFPIPAISQADGGFSTRDPAVLAYVREQCPAPPDLDALTNFNDGGLEAVTCARYWGVDSATVLAAMDRLEAGGHTPYYQWDSLRQLARSATPLQLGDEPAQTCPAEGPVDEDGRCWLWSEYTLPLALPRSAWDAVALDAEHVLVIGGELASDPETTSNYIVDLATLIASPVARLRFPLSSARATQLASGKILAVVNREGESVLFNPISNRWTACTPLADPGVDESSVFRRWLFPEADGNALLLAHNGTHWAVQRFSVDERSWSLVGDPLQAPNRDDPIVVQAADGDLLIMGGVVDDADWPAPITADTIADVQRFDRESGHWTSAAPLPEPLTQAAATLLPDGRIWVAGGTHQTWDCLEDSDMGCQEDSSDDGPRATTWLYDPQSDAWSAASPLAHAEDLTSLVPLADGAMLSLGSRAQRYDAATATWTALGDVPEEYEGRPELFAPDATGGLFVIDRPAEGDGVRFAHLHLATGTTRAAESEEPAICRATTERGFHLRPSPTRESAGPELDGARVVEVLATGDCTRRGTLIFRVRDVESGQTGWAFLMAAELGADCPDFADRVTRAAECP